MDLGGAVRRRRESLGLTVARARKRAGLRQAHWDRIERGEHAVTLPTLLAVAGALDMDPGDLLRASGVPVGGASAEVEAALEGRDEAERWFALEVLALLPELRRRRGASSQPVAAYDRPFPPPEDEA